MSAESRKSSFAPRRGWIDAIVLILAVALAVWSNRVAIRSRRAAESATAERSTLARRLSERVRPNNAADNSSKPRASGSESGIGSKVKVTEFDLAMQSAELRLDRTIDEERFAAYFRQRALTPAQREQFLGLRSQYQQDRLSAEAAAKSEGLGAEDPASVRLRQAAKDRLTAAERALLGEEGLRDLKEYERTLPIRSETIDFFASDLAFTDSPLLADQAENLLKVVDSATSESTGRNREKHTDWTAVITQSRAFLSPQQIVVLDAFATTQRRGELITAVRALIAEPPPNVK